MNTNPLTPDEYDNLFKLLDLIAHNISRLLNSGMVLAESSSDEGIETSRRRIEDYKKRIQKERDRVQTIRTYIQHKKEIDRNRK